MQRCIFVEPWSDSIHIALWRNDGFLHSIHYFSKSNAFSENLMRMKFILHKIFFRMSILSSSKTSRMFLTLLDFQLIIIIIVTIQRLQFWTDFHEIYMVGAVHTWMNPILIEPLLWGTMCPKTGFLTFIQLVWGFLRKKIHNRIRYSTSQRKGYIHFCRLTTHSLKNGLPPPTHTHTHTKNYFSRLF